MRLCDIQIKVEERRIRWGDQEIEEAKVQTVTFGSPCNSPDEIHYHPQQINKERDCLVLTDRCSQCRWRIWDWHQFCHPSAPNARLCVCVCMYVCVPSTIPIEMCGIQEEGSSVIKDLQSSFQTGFLWERLESPSHEGFALQPPVRLGSVLLPHYLPVSRNSCLIPAVNYATAMFTMKAHRL